MASRQRFPQPWSNVTLTTQAHRWQVGAYCVKHIPSGKCWVGVSKDLYAALMTLASNLRRGVCNLHGLQEKYNEDPHFELYFKIVDKRHYKERSWEVANLTAIEWRHELGSVVVHMRAPSGAATRKKPKDVEPAAEPAPQAPSKPPQAVWFPT